VQGIVRGLMEQGLLPRIIAGSSVGAIIASIAAVHTDDELRTLYSNMDNFNLSFFANNSTLEAVFHLMKKGSLQGVPPCLPQPMYTVS
jgi:TAG lipase / steryl ester hydrolase / phospholipase A2 / LPA acyltransferase